VLRADYFMLNFIRTLLSMCAGFRGYRQIRDVPVTDSIKYLLKLMTFLAVVLTVSFIPWALQLGTTFATWVDKHFPPFAVRDGKVVTSVEQPYRAGDADFLLILDTTGRVTRPDPKALQGVLFTADSFLVWFTSTNGHNAAVHSRGHSLRGFPDGVVNGDYFQRLIQSFLWVGLPFLLLLVLLVGLLVTLLQAYLFSFVASLMERGLPGKLELPQLLNIAIHAVTPASIIVTTYIAMQLRGLNLWLIYLIAYAIFLLGAINTCRDLPTVEKQKEDDLL